MTTLRRVWEGVLVFIAVPSLAIAADTTTFKIDSYIPVMFKDLRWTVNGNLNFNGKTDNAEQVPNWSGGIYNEQFDDYSRDLDLSTLVEYRRFRTREEESRRLFLSGSYQSSSSSDTYHPQVSPPLSWYDRDWQNTRWHLDLSYDYTDRYYLFGQFFLYGSLDLNGNLSSTPDDNSTEVDHLDYSVSPDTIYRRILRTHSEANSFSKGADYNVEASLGWGRIYVGAYAATALYMIQELRNHALLVREPDPLELDSLTELIYQYRLKHAVDRRLLTIETISAVTEYLIQCRIIDREGPLPAIYLQDVWDYFPRDDRSFGYRVRFGLGGTRSFAWETHGLTSWWDEIVLQSNAENPDTVDTTVISSVYSMSSFGTYDCATAFGRLCAEFERPLSLKTQLSGSLDGYAWANQDVYDWPYVTRYTSRYQLLMNLGLSYILNSRSRFDFTPSLNYISRTEAIRYESDPPNTARRGHFDQLNYRLSAQLTYRLDIPTALTLNFIYDGTRYHRPEWNSGSIENVGRYSVSATISRFLY